MVHRFPPMPSPPLPVPHGLDAIRSMFGAPSWRPLSGTAVDIDDTWEREHLVRLEDVAGTGLMIRLHALVAPLFEEALAAALAAAPAYRVRMLGGYVPRRKKTLDPEKQAKADLSAHAWGIAFDVNWNTNGFGHQLVTDLPDPFIRAFTDRGWDWGGAWRSSKDAMHFQYCTGY